MNAVAPIDERRLARVSNAELERRHRLVRAHLEANDLDALVVMGTGADLSGGIRWLLDVAAGAYRHTVIFHRRDAMTVIEHGDAGGFRSLGGTDRDRPGVGDVYNVAAFPSAFYSQTYEGRAALEALKTRGYRRIGLANAAGMSHGFVATLEAGLSGVVFTEESEFFDRVRALKSAEEIALIRKAAEMQDEVFRRVLAMAKPGMRDLEIIAFAQAEGRRLGAEAGIFGGSSAPVGTAARFMGPGRQGRTIREGDYFAILIENSGAGGYFAELARTISFGKAPAALTEPFAAVREAQAANRRDFVPGRPVAEVFARYNDWLAAHGLPVEKRIHAHGQGYDLVERPLIRDDDPMVMEAGMCFAIHPTIDNAKVFVTCCDNYMLEAGGLSACLHATEQKVFEV